MDQPFALPPVRSAYDQPHPPKSGGWTRTLLIVAGVLLGLSLALLVFVGLNAPPGKAAASVAAAAMMLVFMASTFAPFAGVLALVIFLARHAAQQRLAMWTPFARQVGGEVVVRPAPLFGYPEAKAILFTHGKIPCVLDIETVGSGKHQRHYTRLTFDLERQTAFGCQIVPQHALSFVTRWFGGQDVRLGWDEFDERFIVKTSDELRAPDVLDRTIQTALLDLRKLAGQNLPFGLDGGYVDLVAGSGRIQIRTHGLSRTTEQLWNHYTACGKLVDLLAPRL